MTDGYAPYNAISAVNHLVHLACWAHVQTHALCRERHLAMDNNSCENTFRPFVIGRKNWLFADTVGGAKASANLYSLIETSKAENIDAYQYLTEMFTVLAYANTADDYEALLPWNLQPIGQAPA